MDGWLLSVLEKQRQDIRLFIDKLFILLYFFRSLIERNDMEPGSKLALAMFLSMLPLFYWVLREVHRQNQEAREKELGHHAK